MTFDENPLRHEMYDYSGRILLLSIVLSLITVALVYLSLYFLMVRPMRRITARLVVFRDDPEVRRQAPSLVAAIDRAVTLCVETLRFARARELTLKRDRVDPPALGDDMGKTLLLSPEISAAWQNNIAYDLTVTGDYDQLFRVFLNLGHNAFAVMETSEEGGEVRINAARRDGRAIIKMTDNGPGLSPRAKDHLFEPFAGSTRSGGSGLGRPIGREIMHAHGGKISIARSDENGPVIRLELPDEG